jgi:hypothetical protein
MHSANLTIDSRTPDRCSGEEPLDFDLFLANTMRFIPMHLGSKDASVSQADARSSFQLPPVFSTIGSHKLGKLLNTGAPSDHLNIDNWVDDLEKGHSQRPIGDLLTRPETP